MGTKRILEPKVEAKGLMDVLELGVMKTVSERLIAGTRVGNSTYISAIVKGIGGGVIHSLSPNKHLQLLGSALIVDAVEDAASASIGGGGIAGGLLGAETGQEDNW